MSDREQIEDRDEAKPRHPRIWINIDADWEGMVSPIHGTGGLPEYIHRDTAAAEKAAAVREAVEAERGRCAEIVRSIGRPHAFAYLRRKVGLDWPAKPQSLTVQALRILRAIRNGGEA